MARTKEEIFNDLIVRKDAIPFLASILASQSKSSFYQTLFDLISEVIGDFELTFDDFVTQIDNLLTAKQVHTPTWWRTVSLSFQLGDALTVNASGNLVYSPVVVANQIIKRAALITSSAGNIQLKVAKLQGTSPIPLTTSENSAFTAYINDVAPAGIIASIVSETGDEIQVGLAVTIDSQIINVSDGTLLSDGTTKPVEVAIQSYFATFQNRDFGGTFYANRLMQTILSANGVVNATFTTLQQKASGQTTFTDVLTATGRSFLTFAGYVRLAEGFDLSTNITYTAD